MTATEAPRSADALLRHYQLPGSSVFMVGTFDKGITVLSQQVRALNLAWALIESKAVHLDGTPGAGPQGVDPSRKRIAIVGAGFAGLTLAAGLLKKRVNADITLFERRDTVLPLQHGSDTRWLHPHIYDWPSRGSESYSAALPVLNWTASRASDVVVQVLKEWADIAETEQPAPERTTSEPPSVSVYCNTRHIQISGELYPPAMTVEWIGEERDKRDPAVPADGRPNAVGDSGSFDIVVLTVGFGLESGARMVYWRNETLAQPHLGQARSTYIVSGSGDGAMIDLFRLRISHFRQDRILAELFSGQSELLTRLRGIQDSAPSGTGFEELRAVWEDGSLKDAADEVQNRLRNRLRQDTTVLLRVRRPSFANLFVDKRVSFQNRLLAYLLYRSGAFTPVTAARDADLRRLAKEHGVPEQRIIIRHGTEKVANLKDVLSDSLHEAVDQCFETPKHFEQQDVSAWPGGYFDMPGLTADELDGRRTKNAVKGHWRKEYLPSPTEAIATAFCSAVTGLLASPSSPTSRLRVTLHRTLYFGSEVVLQQCCDYPGLPVLRDGRRAGRTFPSHNGTIGAAFVLARVIRSKRAATRDALQADMEAMSLDEASQSMSKQVASVAAIPLLGRTGRKAGRAVNVLGVLYLDSYDEDAFVDDETLGRVMRMCDSFLAALPSVTRTVSERIANTEFWIPSKTHTDPLHAIDPANWQALEMADLDAPRNDQLRHLNFDFSDFTPVEQT